MDSRLFILLSNLIIPIVTGQIFLLYFVYFLISYPAKTASYRYFMFFLIGFSLFNFGRPLQLLLGAYPWPLIIVNIRVLILCTVVSPSIMLAANVFRKTGQYFQKRDIFILSISILLGLTYVTFNTLGTKDSYLMLNVADILIQDNLTPSMNPPFFGREVTIAVQIIIGLIMLFFSSYMLLKLKLQSSWKKFLNHKVFYINTGIMIFALSFIYGSLSRQWWVYYTVPVLTAFFFGWSVLKDIKEVYEDYEELIPYIKEEILNNVVFSESSQSRLRKMLICLKKTDNPDTFLIIKTGEPSENITSMLNKQLGRYLDNQDFLMIPLPEKQLGVLIKQASDQHPTDPLLLDHLDILSRILEEKIHHPVSMGIGRSYPGLSQIHTSYKEAQYALAYAETLPGSQIIHVENIQEQQIKAAHYPAKAKENLLNCIRLGDMANTQTVLSSFIDAFERFIRERPENVKYRLYELIGSMIDTAIVAGGNEEKLNHLASKYFEEVDNFTSMTPLRNWLIKLTSEITGIVSRVFESRSRMLVERAKTFMKCRLDCPDLCYKDVAKEVFISPSYFLNLFKQETGQTFMEHLKALRMEKAKELLLRSNKNITRIAFDVGFNDSNYFSSQFTKHVGMTANQYRKQWNKGTAAKSVFTAVPESIQK